MTRTRMTWNCSIQFSVEEVAEMKGYTEEEVREAEESGLSKLREALAPYEEELFALLSDR